MTGVASTLLIKETNQRSLEELSNERQEEFVGGEQRLCPSAVLSLMIDSVSDRQVSVPATVAEGDTDGLWSVERT